MVQSAWSALCGGGVCVRGDYYCEGGIGIGMVVNPSAGGECPECGETVRDAHVRGDSVVLVPCGHAVRALSSLDVPRDVLDSRGD